MDIHNLIADYLNPPSSHSPPPKKKKRSRFNSVPASTTDINISLGHSLGLDESPDCDAVMFPWYPGYKPDIKLSYDDTVGIQLLYGEYE